MSHKIKKKEILKFRHAFKEFMLIRLAYRFDDGDFDEDISSFIDGDSFTINCAIDMIPNDVIFMNLLAGIEIEKEVLNKIIKVWNSKKYE